MTTPTIVISKAPNPVPPGETIGVQVTVTPGTGGGESINVGDVIQLLLTLPAGITVKNPNALLFPAPAAGEPFNLFLSVAASVAPGANAISWTWTNITQAAVPVAGAAFQVPVGFSYKATLVYVIPPAPPTPIASLLTACDAANVPLQDTGFLEKVGAFAVSDTTGPDGSGNAERTIVYALAYACFQQFNGNNALPANTTTRQFYAVTTTGANATIGQLVYDNGTGVGTTVVVPATSGLYLVAAGTANFTGGTQSFTRGHAYTWNGAAWVDEGATKIGRSAFQQNFPARAGAQASPFKGLYTSVIGANTGSVVNAALPAIV